MWRRPKKKYVMTEIVNSQVEIETDLSKTETWSPTVDKADSLSLSP